MKAAAVIGAAFGDEGKGAAVDALAASAAAPPIVVRFNGGAQAGHTVTTPDGFRHIFSHFGSGSLAGASTFLSRFFVVNPRIFLNERVELLRRGNLSVTIDGDAEITTPYDVMINRWAEEARGERRHGSVGIGFGETVERAERGLKFPFRFAYGKIWEIEEKLDEIRKYARVRIERLKLNLDEYKEESLCSGDIVRRFIEELFMMRDLVRVGRLDTRRPIIFEGAQGLLLDQKHGFVFPHLTRSNTGLTNVLELAKEYEINKIEVIYAMRPYTTRHGAGPLLCEQEALADIDVIDETNVEKAWQGKFRLAPLMSAQIKDAIARDLYDARFINLYPSIALSCQDQVENKRLLNSINDRCRKILSVSIDGWSPARSGRIIPSSLLPTGKTYGMQRNLTRV